MSPGLDLDFQRSGPSPAPRGIWEACSGECLKGVETADLALGKPCLFPLSTSATVAQALKAFKYNKDTDSLSVWVDTNSDPASIAQSGHSKNVGIAKDRYLCGGLVTLLDIILFLAREESLVNPRGALKTHLKVFFPSLSQAVQHVHPRTSLCQALQHAARGAALVVPITSSHHRQEGKKFNVPKPLLLSDLPANDFCWISQEDVVRHLLSSCVGTFYPLPMMSLETLGIINTDVMVVDADSPAIRAAPLLQRASKEMSAVAVVTSRYSRGMWARRRRSKKRLEGNKPAKLVGEISTQSLRGCKEAATAAAALATLSVREFLHFIQDDAASDPSHDLVQKVFYKLTQNVLRKSKCVCSRSCPALLVDSSSLRQSSLTSGISSNEKPDFSCDSAEDSSEGSSDEEEDEEDLPSADQELGQSGASRTRADKLHTCTPQSSLVAVMAQALAHRVNHIWVTDRDDGLVGIVTCRDIIRILLSRLHSLKSASSFHAV